MGQKVHPYGFRLGYNKDWHSHWFAKKQYGDYLLEDLKLKAQMKGRFAGAGVSHVDVERAANRLKLIIYTSRPGIIIGRKGAEIDKLKADISSRTGKEVLVSIQEIHKPELNAQLQAEKIAAQLEKRIAFRRAMRKTVEETLRFGGQGIKVKVAGRLNGAEIARTEWHLQGRLPLHTLRADVDYGFAEAHTTFGVIGVKCWIYRGEILDPKAAMARGTQPDPINEPRPERGGRPRRDRDSEDRSRRERGERGNRGGRSSHNPLLHTEAASQQIKSAPSAKKDVISAEPGLQRRDAPQKRVIETHLQTAAEIYPEESSMVKGAHDVTYLAHQFAGRVIIIATGQYPTTGIQARFQDTPVSTSPPEFKFVREVSAEGLSGPATPFAIYVSFPTSNQIRQVFVRDDVGRHSISVSQVQDKKSLSRLLLNGSLISVKKIETNSLTSEGCEEFDLDSVDMYTGHTSLSRNSLPLIKDTTYGLIYFSPGKVDLPTPISSETCIKLDDVGEGRTIAEVYSYSEGRYKKQDFDFTLEGTLGCTAVINLGFCLLKSVHGISTRSLSTVTILDQVRAAKHIQSEVEITDDIIFNFCKTKGVETVMIGTQSDCPYYDECKHQSGDKCAFFKAKCR